MKMKESTGIKKRRKTTHADDNEGEGDIYSKVIEFEEKESAQRSAADDATIYLQLCQSIRKFLANAVEWKKDNSSEAKSKLQQGLTESCAMIAVLKKLNRLDKFRTISARENLNLEKQKVDSTNLQYHNLLYEAAHLVSQFTKCKQFKSKDENIELISIEKFLKVGPEAVTSQFRSENLSADPIKHQLHLAMLEWELTQRKAQAQLCDKLEDEKKRLAADIAELKDRLEGIGPKLSAVLEASKPLQEYFGLPIDKIETEHKLARLLPEPLYLLYSLTDGYKQVYNINMSVEVLGDVEEANQWRETHRDVDTKVDVDSEIEFEQQETEEVVEVVKKRRHRKQSTVDKHEEKRKALLEPHPLSVQITIVVKPEYVMNIKFVFRPQLNVITVDSSFDIPSSITAYTAREVLIGESILNELFQRDFGIESPNSANSYQLQRVGLGSFSSLIPKLGYVYEWAQEICGFDCLNVNKPVLKPKPSHVELVMKTLYKRLKSRVALAELLARLETDLSCPQPPEEVECPRGSVAALSKWASSNYQSFCQGASAAALVEAEVVEPDDLFYTVAMTRQKAALHASVVLKNDYPTRAAVFCVSVKFGREFHSGNCTAIRDMERAVNVNFDPRLLGSEHLLLVQLKHLSACFDVYLETMNDSSFPQTAVFFQTIW